MDQPFNVQDFFNQDITDEQSQSPTSDKQKAHQPNITDDLIDTVAPSQTQTDYSRTSQISADPPFFDLLTDSTYTKPISLNQSQSTPEYSTPPVMDLFNSSPTTYGKPSQYKNHYVGGFQNTLVSGLYKENLTGIHAFFNSRELPPTPKQISLSDIPAGLEAIPFIFKNKCYYQGIDLLDQYMKLAPTSEEKMYYKILKIMCLIKLSMWDNVASEFSSIGNLEKMIMESKHEIYLPYHLRLLYALAPFLATPLQQKSTSSSSTKASDEKTLDRLFNLYYFCENKVGELDENALYQDENIDMFTICDADISPQQWAARLFHTTLLIIEILLYKSSTRTANEVIKNALQKFPRNDILMAYMIRLKQLQGDYADARFFLDKISQKLPKNEHLEFISFNTFMQVSYELKYPEAKKLLEELAHKYPQYSTLAYNNLAYIHITEGQIVKAIDILENIIRTEPWNINEVIVLNLIHLYDFYYVDNKSRKKTIDEIVDRYAVNFNRAAIAHEMKS